MIEFLYGNYCFSKQCCHHSGTVLVKITNSVVWSLSQLWGENSIWRKRNVDRHKGNLIKTIKSKKTTQHVLLVCVQIFLDSSHSPQTLILKLNCLEVCVWEWSCDTHPCDTGYMYREGKKREKNKNQIFQSIKRAIMTSSLESCNVDSPKHNNTEIFRSIHKQGMSSEPSKGNLLNQ